MQLEPFDVERNTAESLAACVYTGPDGSKQARGKDTNSVFSEGLRLEFCSAPSLIAGFGNHFTFISVKSNVAGLKIRPREWRTDVQDVHRQSLISALMGRPPSLSSPCTSVRGPVYPCGCAETHD